MKNEHDLLSMIECLSSFTKELVREEIHNEKKDKENFVEFKVQFNKVKEMMFVLSSKPYFDVLTNKVLVNIESSFHHVVLLDKTNKKRSQQKIEFELIPLLKILYISCYYFSLIHGDKDRESQFDENEYKKFISNHYIVESEKNRDYKYEVTFVITGYNKLSYTKQCVQSLLDTIPSSLSYELILINHGSTDETSDYFESICEEYPHLPIKKIDLQENDLLFSIYVIHLIAEGEFFFSISNDIIFHENSVENLLTCIKADESHKFVVPSAPFIGNCQEPIFPESILTLEDMIQWAKENNKSNPFLWEHRVTLYNPVAVYRSKDVFSENALLRTPFFIRFAGWGGNDDVQSVIVRRSGNKCILAKDAFCYHFGNVTIKELFKVVKREEIIARIDATFEKASGIPYSVTGRCYSRSLFKELCFPHTASVKVLGLNCGLCANPLKIKESYKEFQHNLDCYVTNVQDTKEFILDMPSLSDSYEMMEQFSDLDSHFTGKKYQWILYEDKFSFEFEEEILYQEMKEALTDDGVIILGQPTEVARAYLTPHEMVEYEHQGQEVAFLIYKK